MCARATVCDSDVGLECVRSGVLICYLSVSSFPLASEICETNDVQLPVLSVCNEYQDYWM